ncbi:MAG: NAD-dependent dehydratase [Bacteriovoracaceae bacterium]|nr:NAD-dependent dehydratase [Bacteriovoracaceae bacterium]
MKHVLITGGAGFIGSHLCDTFIARGYAVTAIDNFLTGKISNLDRVIKNPHFDFLKWDVCEPIPVQKVRFLSEFGLQGILHFACPPSPVDFEKIPFEILKVDSLGTINTVDLAIQYSARYLLASTSEVYGDPLEHPQTETYFGNVNSVGPRACYDEAKRFSEAYVSTSMRGLGLYRSKKYKPLNAAIVRIFNTYGPRMRQDDGRVIPEFCTQALRGGELPVCGDGSQTRSLCFVSDLVEGIVRLFEGNVHKPVNIGNPDERSVFEMARFISELVYKMTGVSSKIKFVPARPEDPRKRKPNTDLAQKLLGWKPNVSLTEGLKMTILSMQNLIARPLAHEAPFKIQKAL